MLGNLEVNGAVLVVCFWSSQMTIPNVPSPHHHPQPKCILDVNALFASLEAILDDLDPDMACEVTQFCPKPGVALARPAAFAAMRPLWTGLLASHPSVAVGDDASCQNCKVIVLQAVAILQVSYFMLVGVAELMRRPVVSVLLVGASENISQIAALDPCSAEPQDPDGGHRIRQGVVQCLWGARW